jgi:hypothetical protein
MSDSDVTSKPVAWKSKLLESLGVKSAVVVEHGPSGHRCGLALTAALAVAVGAFTVPAVAAESVSGQSEQVQQSGVVKSGGAEENSAIYDVARLTSSLFLGRLLYAEDEPETVVQRTVGIAGTAIRISAAAPVMGAYMVLDEVHGTYMFVQEREQRQCDEKMVQVSERVARVQREEVQRIRMDERTARAAMPQRQREADHQRMMGLVLDAKEIGYVPAELEVRLEVEKAIELKGQPTEDWYTLYKSPQSAQEFAEASQPSSRTKFMDGMNRMSTALDNQALAAQSQPNITPPGPR